MFTQSRRRVRLTMALVSLGLLAAVTATAGTQVIAHAAVSDTGLGAGNVQNIFLGKQTSWSDGTPIEVGVIGSGPVAEDFLKTRVKKTASQYSTFWKKAVFSGTGTAPREFATDAEMAAWVAATPGAIGFVAEGAATDGCKILSIQ